MNPLQFESPLKKKKKQEKTAECTKRCIIHVVSSTDNNTVYAFT